MGSVRATDDVVEVHLLGRGTNKTGLGVERRARSIRASAESVLDRDFTHANHRSKGCVSRPTPSSRTSTASGRRPRSGAHRREQDARPAPRPATRAALGL